MIDGGDRLSRVGTFCPATEGPPLPTVYPRIDGPGGLFPRIGGPGGPPDGGTVNPATPH